MFDKPFCKRFALYNTCVAPCLQHKALWLNMARSQPENESSQVLPAKFVNTQVATTYSICIWEIDFDGGLAASHSK